MFSFKLLQTTLFLFALIRMSSTPRLRKHFTYVGSPTRNNAVFNDLFKQGEDSDSVYISAQSDDDDDLIYQGDHSGKDDDLIYEGDSGEDLVSDFYGEMELARPAKTRKKNPGNEPIAKQSSASSQWTIEAVEGSVGYSHVKHKRNTLISVQVCSNRVNKAKEKLDPKNIHNVLTSGSSCDCSNRCNETTVAFKDILNLRTFIW